MHRMVIHKLGPIDHCELEMSQFMTFTGFQASGKSTIAKAVYYFRTIKDDIYTLAQVQALQTDLVFEETDLKRALISQLREKFMRVFGSSRSMDNDMYIEYHFTKECFVKVSLKDDPLYDAPNYIWITLSACLTKCLDQNDFRFTSSALGIPDLEKQKIRTKLDVVFNDPYEIVYIPAGRSMLTLLSQQLSYIYSTMKDSQKRTIDYCTQDYIERILQLKPEFSDGLDGLAAYSGDRSRSQKRVLDSALALIKRVLKGSYQYSNGEERIAIDDKKYVKINFSSSGQQESVWILNLLFYYLVKKKPVLFIIEEPESNLFPESQKYITELISLVNNCNHSVVVTTHSPYVLGTMNNLLYAYQVADQQREQAALVISEDLWINPQKFSAFFVKHGGVEDCIDRELQLVKNEMIDEISKEINQDFDKLFEIQLTNDESGDSDAT